MLIAMRFAVLVLCTSVIGSIPTMYSAGVTRTDARHQTPGTRYDANMEFRRYEDASPFLFGDLELRELTPDAFSAASFAEVIVPIGADRTPRVSEKDHRMYVCLVGEIEFEVEGEVLRLRRGDVLHIDKGERYGFHNGGYEEGRLLLIRVPGPALPGGAQP